MIESEWDRAGIGGSLFDVGSRVPSESWFAVSTSPAGGDRATLRLSPGSSFSENLRGTITTNQARVAYILVDSRFGFYIHFVWLVTSWTIVPVFLVRMSTGPQRYHRKRLPKPVSGLICGKRCERYFRPTTLAVDPPGEQERKSATVGSVVGYPAVSPRTGYPRAPTAGNRDLTLLGIRTLLEDPSENRDDLVRVKEVMAYHELERHG